MTSVLRTPLRLAAPLLLAAGGLLSTPAPATAGWDNVFQVCCHDCRPRAVRSYYVAPAPVQRQVNYEQRCYYEPVTVMKPVTERVEVPVQVKSYYWDPVTTYTRSSYYDPCTGCCQDICVPRTSYVRRESCNTVMRYVERIRMVPTQVSRRVCETRPVYTYYGPTTKSYDCDPCELPPAANGAAPRVDVVPGAPPGVSADPGDRIAPPNIPTSPNSLPRTAPPSARPVRGVNALTTSRSSAVRGEVVRDDRITPRPGAKLVFLNASNTTVREYAQADAFGNFDVKLPAGDWYVYVGTGDGRAHYQKKVTVGEYDSREFKLVSR